MNQSPLSESLPFIENKVHGDVLDFIVKNVHDGLVITDNQFNINAVNDSYLRLSGYEISEVVNKKPSFFNSYHHNSKFYSKLHQQILTTGTWNGSVWDRKKNGELFLIQVKVHAFTEKEDGQPFYVIIISDQTHVDSKSIRQSYYDPLTNLPNRILLKDRLKYMLAHAKRDSSSVALLLLDVNRFKRMNDMLGFDAGDLLLIAAASRIRSCLRECDSIFRLGNDEFVIVLEDILKIEDILKVAQKIISIFHDPIELESIHEKIYLTVSIGISSYPDDGTNFEELIKNAETALYQIKSLSQNSFQHYNPAMNAKTLGHLSMEHRIHKALENHEFTIYFQPIVDLKTMKIVRAEALIRWKHPELGLISPAEFIPIAEETNLIIPLGTYVLQMSCETLKHWHALGFTNLHVAVNLSARQFLQHNLIQNIQSIMQSLKFNPHFIELEITESVGMKNAEQTVCLLNELKQLGFHIAIDDFGTGYSSLSYLKKFPIDTLKIDQSFVRDISADDDNETIVSLIINMAHTLNIQIVAEGVETKEQLNFLRNHACDTFQGYLFSRPVPAEDFEKLLVKYYSSQIPADLLLPSDE